MNTTSDRRDQTLTPNDVKRATKRTADLIELFMGGSADRAKANRMAMRDHARMARFHRREIGRFPGMSDQDRDCHRREIALAARERVRLARMISRPSRETILQAHVTHAGRAPRSTHTRRPASRAGDSGDSPGEPPSSLAALRVGGGQ